MMNNSNAWQKCRNLLAIRLDAMGDVLMTTPALRALREGSPGRRVTLLTSAVGAAIAVLVPEVDEIIVYDAPWMKATKQRADSRPEFAMIDRLRRGQFDGAVLFTVYSQNPLPTALLCQLAGIPLRLAHCRENPYQLLTDWVPEPEPDQVVRHEVRRQLDLVAAIGCRTENQRLSLRTPIAAQRRVLRLLLQLAIAPDSRWVVIHPGASAPSRRYPPESYAEVARRLVADHGCEVLFTGTESERDLIAQVQKDMGVPSHSLAGRLELADLAALLAFARVVIANNTGPAHIAAAVGTPVVDLYALTNPQHTPWGVPCRVLNHDVPCKFCYKSVCPEGHHQCLRSVSPEVVAHAVCELMAETPRPSRRLRTAGDKESPFSSFQQPTSMLSHRAEKSRHGKYVAGRWRSGLALALTPRTINHEP